MSGIYQVYTMIINFLGFPDGGCSSGAGGGSCQRPEWSRVSVTVTVRRCHWHAAAGMHAGGRAADHDEEPLPMAH